MGKQSSSKPRIGDVKIESKTAKIHQKHAADVKKKADVNIKTAASSFNKQRTSNVIVISGTSSHPVAPLVGTPAHLVELAPNVPETSFNNPVNQGFSQHSSLMEPGLNGRPATTSYTTPSLVLRSAVSPSSRLLNAGSEPTSNENALQIARLEKELEEAKTQITLMEEANTALKRERDFYFRERNFYFSKLRSMEGQDSKAVGNLDVNKPLEVLSETEEGFDVSTDDDALANDVGVLNAIDTTQIISSPMPVEDGSTEKEKSDGKNDQMCSESGEREVDAQEGSNANCSDGNSGIEEAMGLTDGSILDLVAVPHIQHASNGNYDRNSQPIINLMFNVYINNPVDNSSIDNSSNSAYIEKSKLQVKERKVLISRNRINKSSVAVGDTDICKTSKTTKNSDNNHINHGSPQPTVYMEPDIQPSPPSPIRRVENVLNVPVITSNELNPPATPFQRAVIMDSDIELSPNSLLRYTRDNIIFSVVTPSESDSQSSEYAV